MPWVAAVIAGGAAIGNIMSNMDAADRAQMMQNFAFQELVKAKIPDPKLQQLALQRFVQTGELTPEMEQVVKQSPSEMEKIVTSQAHKAVQNRSLQELEQIGLDGGLRLQDKAALQDAQLQGQVQDRGNRLAIQDNMSRRGLGGSGFDLQAQLQGQQAAGDRDAKSGLTIAAQAQDRALQSLMGAGDLATKYRSQDFDEQAQKAKATDAINQFNTRAAQDVQHSNVGMQNRAQEMNLGEQQRIADANVGVANHEQEYNKNLIQQQFENQLNVAKGKAAALTGQANGALQQGQAQGNAFTNIGQAGSGIASAYGASNAKSGTASGSGYGSTAKTSPNFWDSYEQDDKDKESPWRL